jgi:hypothetical protein
MSAAATPRRGPDVFQSRLVDPRVTLSCVVAVARFELLQETHHPGTTESLSECL